MNNSKECPSFEGCNASLCPLEESSLKNGIWYPDDEICKNQKFNQLEWIKRQRELSTEWRSKTRERNKNENWGYRKTNLW